MRVVFFFMVWAAAAVDTDVFDGGDVLGGGSATGIVVL